MSDDTLSRAELNELRRKELEQIESEHGGITPALVVDAASDEDSALHDWFTWDDSEAAHAHRLAQARQLIRVVYVQDDKQQKGPAFYHVTTDDERRYVSVVRVSSDADLFGSALRELTVKVRIAVESVERLSELRDVPALVPIRRALLRAAAALEKVSE